MSRKQAQASGKLGSRTMKRWTDLVLVACAGCVAIAQWLGPDSMEGLLSGLLFGLVVLTILSQRNAIQLTLDSLNGAHREQLESERRYRALFDACSDVILVYRFDEHGRPGTDRRGQRGRVSRARVLARRSFWR